MLEGSIVFPDNRRKPFGFDGLAIDYLSLLQDSLSFQCKTPLKLYRNGTGFTSFIRDMEKCAENGAAKETPECQCDLGVAGWMLNEDRLRRVDYVAPFALDAFRVVTHIDKTATSIQGAFFLSTFTATVWLCIAMLMVLFIFLKLLDSHFAPPDNSFTPLPKSESRFRRYRHFLLKSKIPRRLGNAVRSTLSKMIGMSTNDIVGDFSSTRQWVLNFAIVMCGLFLVLAYEAVMTASLVQGTIHSDYRSIEDFKSCRILSRDVCLPRGGAIEAFWENAIAKSKCYQNRPDKHPRTYGTYDELEEKVASKKCKFILVLGSVAGDAVNGRYCGTLTKTGDPCFEGGLSFVLPRGSQYTIPMSAETLRMRQENAIPTIDQYFARQGLCKLNATPSLSFKKLKIFFFLAFGSCLVLFLSMLFDMQFESKRGPEDVGKKVKDDTVGASEVIRSDRTCDADEEP